MTVKRFLLWTLIVIVAVGVVFRLILALGVRAKITSWWRTPWHNSEVNGHPFSRHQFGLAYDVSPPNAADHGFLLTLASVIPTARVVNEGDHLHFQVV